MGQAVLWIDILAFAVLLAGLGAEFLAYLRRREPWRALYMVSILVYDLLMLVQAFSLFNARYVERPMAGLPLFAGLFRSAVSVLLAMAFPFCIARASGMRPGRLGRALLWLPALLTAAFIAASLAGAPQVFGVVVNVAFNAFIAAFSVIGCVRVARGLSDAPKSEVLPFLAMSAAAYSCFVLIALAIIAGAKPQAPSVSPLVSGAFCLAWGCLLVVSAVRRSQPPRGAAGELSPRFVADHGFSQREAEVAALLVAGLTNRQIGERLFISPRTVESHVYNLYRKCGCRNKAELINKAYAYDPDLSIPT
jgi:DNA-binding CsgD family transcriptional regulator